MDYTAFFLVFGLWAYLELLHTAHLIRDRLWPPMPEPMTRAEFMQTYSSETGKPIEEEWEDVFIITTKSQKEADQIRNNKNINIVNEKRLKNEK